MTLSLALFRFQLVIPLVVLLCFARKWKLLIGFTLTLVVVTAVSVAIVQPASWLAYPRYLLTMNSGLQTEAQRLAHAIYPDQMPNLRGLVQLLLGARVPSVTLQVFTIVASLALLGWAILKRLPFELLAVVALLVSYHGLIHDSVLLLLPLLTCGIVSPMGIEKRLIAWSLVAAAPTLLFALHLPLALLSLVYLGFLVVMANGTAEVGKRLAAQLDAAPSHH
jgi:hypothetical protein